MIRLFKGIFAIIYVSARVARFKLGLWLLNDDHFVTAKPTAQDLDQFTRIVNMVKQENPDLGFDEIIFKTCANPNDKLIRRCGAWLATIGYGEYLEAMRSGKISTLH